MLLFIVSGLALLVLAAATIQRALRRAPVGFEDGAGFHLLPSTAASTRIREAEPLALREKKVTRRGRDLRFGAVAFSFAAHLPRVRR
jgi:hypothetical protein